MEIHDFPQALCGQAANWSTKWSKKHYSRGLGMISNVLIQFADQSLAAPTPNRMWEWHPEKVKDSN